MATTVKEKGGSGSSSSGTDKMKKTTSQNKKTPVKSSPLSSSSSSSSSDQKPQKPIPNYLKPTISSSHISTKPATTTTSSSSSSVGSRRSHPIEKPPLPGQAQKAQAPKPNAPQRSLSNLSSKPTKTGAVPTMRRSISAKGSSSSSTKKVAAKKGVSQPESLADDADVGHDKAPSDHVVGGEVGEVVHNYEQPTAQPDNDHDRETKEQGDEKAQEEVEEESPVIDSKEGYGLVEDHVDEEKVAEEKDETLVQVSMEGSKAEEEEEEEGTKQAEAGKEAQDYNDVIEETATKLMEDTNKVRALAGAFETVISLQDTK